MTETPKLDILIASFSCDGLLRLSRLNLPEIDGVRWIISSQIPGRSFPTPPQSLIRKDILIKFSDSKGSSVNRNILLDMAEAPICLIADDDQIFYADGIKEIINTFNKDPNLSVATFKYDNLPEKYRVNPLQQITDIAVYEKHYPDYSFPLDKPVKNFFISAIEIAFRLKDIKQSHIRFNEWFGVNAKYHCGEDTIFLYDCLKANLKAIFFPILITTHLGYSTGNRLAGDKDVLRAQGLLIPLQYPLTGFPRIILKAWRSARFSHSNLFFCLRHALHGWFDFYRYKSRLFHPN